MYKKCYQGKKLDHNLYEMHLWEEDGKHQGAAMVTTKASGVFRENNNLARKEFFDSLKINNGGHNI